MKTRIKHVSFPALSNYQVHIEFAKDLKKAMSQYEHTKNIDPDPDVDGVAVQVKDEPMSFIFLRSNADVGSIAHEAWHVVRRMMRYLGIELDSETVAYHLGYLVNQIASMR